MIPTIRNQPFVAFNQGSPLNLTQHDEIPFASLRGLLYFYAEDHTTPTEHIKDVSNLCVVHHVTEENVALRLLVALFKEKALQWFKGLPVNSIETWDELGSRLCKFFEDKSDHLSLVEQLSAIKRAPHEDMSDFNHRFQRTWDRIPQMVRPTANHAFLYYLRALNSDIYMMIQSMGGDTLLAAYSVAIRAENSHIQAGKIAPRPPMPIFPTFQPPMQLPPLVVIPSAPTLPAPDTQPNGQSNTFPA